jgi:pimeloyl-ACP methyl ester carboxylesterase
VRTPRRSVTRATAYLVDGVAVHRYRPATPNGLPPVVLVHGGAHASWVWERYGPFLASRGWDCHALDWAHHGDSAPLPAPEFVGRGITAVHAEIATVTRALPRCHLVGHSMGALAALHSATSAVDPVSLTLITPVVPAQVRAEPVPVPVDLGVPFAVPPFPVAKRMFFPAMSDAEALPYYEKLRPESSRAVWEATRWTVPVALDAVRAPVFVIAAAEDALTPPGHVRALATLLDARYAEYAGLGHTDVLLKAAGWRRPAADVEEWLRGR